MTGIEEVRAGGGNDLIDMRGYLGPVTFSSFEDGPEIGLVGGIVAKGGNGNDVLIGSGQDDWLHGERGSDAMAGGDGDDVFVFGGVNLSAGEANDDMIVDFQAGDRLLITSGTLEATSFDGTNSTIIGDLGLDTEFTITVLNYKITDADFYV